MDLPPPPPFLPVTCWVQAPSFSNAPHAALACRAQSPETSDCQQAGKGRQGGAPPLASASRPGNERAEGEVPTLGAQWPEVSLPRPVSPEAKELAPQCSGIRALRTGAVRRSCCLGAQGRGAWRLCEPAGARVPRVGSGHTCGYHPSPVPCLLPGSGTSLPSGTRMLGYAEQPKEPREACDTRELEAGSHQVAPRRVRYLPSRPLQMPGGAAAGNPGPSPASGPQAEPEPRRAASRGAAALRAGGFSVSFLALAGTGLPGARRGRGRECARVGRCGRAWMWVCMCVCVFMGEVGVCVRV